MQQSQELIDIQEVADSFGKSVESIRKYKNFGIIRVSDKRGNKDLFDRDEIMSIRERLRELRSDLQWEELPEPAEQVWTDDFASILPYIQWRNVLGY